MLKSVAAFVLACCSFTLAYGADDSAPAAAAQKLFDAMRTHDAPGAASLFLPGASLSSVDAAGKTSVIPFEKFVERIGASNKKWLERIWNTKVLEHGSVAVVWADYDFYLDGKFSHCGVDAFQMLKTPADGRLPASAIPVRLRAANRIRLDLLQAINCSILPDHFPKF